MKDLGNLLLRSKKGPERAKKANFKALKTRKLSGLGNYSTFNKTSCCFVCFLSRIYLKNIGNHTQVPEF